MRPRFELVCVDTCDDGGQQRTARRGVLHCDHGTVQTPAFMPVGTRGTVKGLTPQQLRDTGAEMLLANTYHLALRPGPEVVAQLGGLHRFMAWDGPILTDSGGFQIFSLSSLRKISDDGVTFNSHIDGALIELTPERAIQIQTALGADFMMAFDECPPLPSPPDIIEQAVGRTLRWAKRSRDAHTNDNQALLGIVQGGLDGQLRRQCAASLQAIGFDGYAVGGLSVGESAEDRNRTLDDTTPYLPDDQVRYLMGVGKPADLVEAVARGIDMFDCVMPTRHGRNAYAFTWSGAVRLRNEQHRQSTGPLDDQCGCYTCRTFTLGYLRHLFTTGEMLGPILVSLHNIAFFQKLLHNMRSVIALGEYGQWLAKARASSWYIKG